MSQTTTVKNQYSLNGSGLQGPLLEQANQCIERSKFRNTALSTLQITGLVLPLVAYVGILAGTCAGLLKLGCNPGLIGYIAAIEGLALMIPTGLVQAFVSASFENLRENNYQIQRPASRSLQQETEVKECVLNKSSAVSLKVASVALTSMAGIGVIAGTYEGLKALKVLMEFNIVIVSLEVLSFMPVMLGINACIISAINDRVNS